MPQFPTCYVRPTGIKMSVLCTQRLRVPYPHAQLTSLLFGRNGAQAIQMYRILQSDLKCAGWIKTLLVWNSPSDLESLVHFFSWHQKFNMKSWVTLLSLVLKPIKITKKLEQYWLTFLFFLVLLMNYLSTWNSFLHKPGRKTPCLVSRDTVLGSQYKDCQLVWFVLTGTTLSFAPENRGTRAKSFWILP